jgi:hypothetical protein
MDPAITRIFLIKKIAGVFHDTVEWKGEGERADTDWKEATRLVDANPHLIRHYSEKEGLSDATSYAEFERTCGNYVWHAAQGLRRDLPRPPYGMVTFD